MGEPKPIEIFELARKEYPGTKRGKETEFKEFIKHKDWKEALLLLKPAIDKQAKAWRKTNTSTKYIPHFRTWLHQRRWEIELAEDVKKQDEKKREIAKKNRIRNEYRNEYFDYLNGKTTEALLDIKKDRGHLWQLAGWLIEEIIESRRN